MIKNNIRKIFTKRGETAFEFSARTGFPVNYIYQWQREEIIPTLKMAMKLAKLLNCTVDDIWYEDNK